TTLTTETTKSTTIATTTAEATTAATTTTTSTTNATTAATTTITPTTKTTTNATITTEAPTAATTKTMATPTTETTTRTTNATTAEATSTGTITSVPPSAATAITTLTANATKAGTTTMTAEASTAATNATTAATITTATPTTKTTTNATMTAEASTITENVSVTSSTVFTEFTVAISITLDKEFTPDLNNQASLAYKELELKLNLVLKDQYRQITGFIRAFVKAFRQGSIIVDFEVQTTQLNYSEIAAANSQLPTAMKSVATLLGDPVASYQSKSLQMPAIIYTGKNMTLTCGSSKIDLGEISASEWTFNGQKIENGKRFEIITSGAISTLAVNNVILADIGLYKCTLKAQGIDFIQEGNVTGDIIKEAPVVRLHSQINVKCREGLIQELDCCVQFPYKVNWVQDKTILPSNVSNHQKSYCIKHTYQLKSCSALPQTKNFTCVVDELADYESTTSLTIFSEDIICKDDRFGTGRTGDQSTIWCDEGLEGSITAVCEGSGNWKTGEDTCIVTAIKELLIFSEQLTEVGVPEFAGALNAVVQSNKSEISNSSLTISVVVNIVNKISVLSAVNQAVMKDVLETVDAIISEDSRDSWIALNLNKTDNSSSELLGSLEGLSDKLVGEFEIETGQVILNKTSFSDPFVANVNSSVTINISNTSSENASVITTMLLTGLINVMPTRNQSINNETDNTINAAVVLVKIDTKIGNVILTFNKLNNTLKLNPQCVFWNFTAFNNLGAWDDFGCTFVSDINDIVTCNCTHLTSFSILMSTRLPVVRPGVKVALDLITYVGVGISLASLVICLILEGYVWKAVTRNSTAFMRHVSIVNTALSLLIADICFIIAASFAKNPGENPGEDYNVPVGPCSAATFFMHLFYLALFFWMLVSGLLLFYRTVMIFSHMSKSAMLAIGFCLGYGCPLVIAVVTVAVTAPSGGYVQGNEACWLNWTKSKALLALVIPALTIVLVNILILIVIITKILSRDVGESVQTDEKHALVVIARCVIILTPLFGLTWSLGVGTMVSSTNEGIHIAFAFFNSLQGFFILVFGTLLDSKVRSVLSKKATTSTSSSLTKVSQSKIGGVSVLDWINRLRGRRYIYHVSQAANSSGSDPSASYSSI
uniref:Uncharacterized protein n=1 Tax=Tetraodon nigroviridis TaxID=99883 RepID=H3C5V0_TETNG